MADDLAGMGERRRRFVELDTEFDADLRIERCHVVERLSEPFTILLDVHSMHGEFDFLPHLGLRCSVTLFDQDEPVRRLNGMLFASRRRGAESIDGRDVDEGVRYRLEIRPWFYFLTLGTSAWIDENMTALQAIEGLFKGWESLYDPSRLAGTYPKREYVVQYGESGFDYASRLLEEEGIHYFFEHKDDEHVMVFADNLDVHPISAREEIRFGRELEQGAFSPRILSWDERVRSSTQKESNVDWDWRTASQTFKKAANIRSNQKFPGRAFNQYPTHVEGADAMLQAEMAEQQLYMAETNVSDLICGERFTLKGHEDRFNVEYLIVGSEWSIQNVSVASTRTEQDRSGWECRLEVTPADIPWRPRRKTPKRRVHGPHTAVVIGTDDDKEIYCDEHGRVRVRMFWAFHTAEGKQSADCWVRVVQPWAGGAYGFQLVPRVGHEVVIDFFDGDPERPFISGRMHNGSNRVPSDNLPAKKTRSTWRSQTVHGDTGQDYPNTKEPPSGVGFNEIYFEDLAGEELIYTHAQRDMKTWIRRNESRTIGSCLSTWIGHDEYRKVGNDQTQEIDNNQIQKIAVNQTEDVGVDQTMTVGSNRVVQVGSNHNESVGVNQTVTIGSNQDITVGSNRTVTIGSNEDISVGVDQNQSVGSNQNEKIGANRTLEIGANDDETIGTNHTRSVGVNSDNSVGVNYSLDVGAQILIKAGAMITLECGGSKIEMTPFSIKMESLIIQEEATILHASEALVVTTEGTVALMEEALLTSVEGTAILKEEGAIVLIN